MECNRDEAHKAKKLAETKLKERDLEVAKRYAKKAQKLCPDLEGITHLLKRLGVNDSSDNKISDGGSIPFCKTTCNRDEAIRARSIAESRLKEKDFEGAKRFALKAQDLCPGLHSISQFRTTIKVYEAAAECNKINGEVDWYSVLGVSPDADDKTIREQYKNLVLAVHPDKNKSLWADDACKLINEAYALLSNDDERSAYNRRRGCDS